MELVRGNDCVVDTSNNPHTRYLFDNACVLAERDSKTAEMTKGVSGRRGGTIPLVSGSDMDTERILTVYNQQCGGGDTNAYTPISNLRK